MKNGSRYQEKTDRGSVSTGTELVRMSFKQYKKVMDLSSFKMSKTDDSSFKHNYQMLTLPQLTRSIDSLKQSSAGYSQKAAQMVALNVKDQALSRYDPAGTPSEK